MKLACISDVVPRDDEKMHSGARVNIPDRERKEGRLDDYLPRIGWTPSGKLCLTWMNRHQSMQRLLLADPATGVCSVLLEEKSKLIVPTNKPINEIEKPKTELGNNTGKGIENYQSSAIDPPATKEQVKTNAPQMEDNPIEHKHHPVTEQEKAEEFKKQTDEAVEIGTQ